MIIGESLRTRRLAISIVLLCFFSTLSQAKAASGRLQVVDVPAPSLADNLLGTATTQTAAIYVPPGYDGEGSEQRYPALYLLHGIFDSHEVWPYFHDLPAMLDRLVAAGEVPEMIVVMPDAGNQYGGGFYRNSPVSGRWADYIVDDLIGYVDTEFRTLSKAESRAISGHSMGGYGALHLAMTRPGVFSVVWAMSPCCLSARDDFGFGNVAWRRSIGIESPEDLDDIMASEDFYAIATLGVIAAFSPDVNNPPTYGEFPFTLARGELVPVDEVYDRYLDELPVRQVRKSRDALRNLRGLAMGVGLDDQFRHIPGSVLEFSQRLGSERVPHLLDVYEGDHRQKISERLEQLVLPWIGEHIVIAE